MFFEDPPHLKLVNAKAQSNLNLKFMKIVGAIVKRVSQTFQQLYFNNSTRNR